MLARKPRHKDRKNNKSNKIEDLGKEEAKKGLEMSANVAKANKDFACQLKAPITNIAKIARITKVTRFKT